MPAHTVISDETKDGKSRLAFLVQIFIGRSVKKTDVVYDSTANAATGIFEATVTLSCMGEQPQFKGESLESRKEAEKEAAKSALDFYSDDIERIVQEAEENGVTKKKKRKAGKGSDRPNPNVIAYKAAAAAAAAAEAEEAEDGDEPAAKVAKVAGGLPVQQTAGRVAAPPQVAGRVAGPPPGSTTAMFQEVAAMQQVRTATGTGKGKLYEFLSKACGTTPPKETIIWDKEQSTWPKGYRATLQITALNERWCDHQWVGDYQRSIKDAEHDVSEKALADLATDPEYESFIQGMKAKQEKAQSIWPWASPGGLPAPAQPKPVGVVRPSKPVPVGLWSMGGGNAAQTGPREEVESDVTTGEISTLRKDFGYIKPDGELLHPAAEFKERLYFRTSDVDGAEGTDAPAWLTEGAKVSFKCHLSATGGLAAHDVEQL
eukprot:TRINITY_DN79993_c0_g1_i1.p1 TRINITY_DN79993_c0_g1~~TRINITY_DN79993_c0_g1_i1.p1  ORF type:complete len:431 (-),score=132.83 TRINITY_DN79993_c0_g1_i1:152-1444(-)